MGHLDVHALTVRMKMKKRKKQKKAQKAAGGLGLPLSLLLDSWSSIILFTRASYRSVRIASTITSIDVGNEKLISVQLMLTVSQTKARSIIKNARV
ncbi:hypothetical protein BGX23_000625 [Mortierella sp. AD031]|nr:hypothetical protein BGX23_000625 [Mortierella sp. AD031]